MLSPSRTRAATPGSLVAGREAAVLGASHNHMAVARFMASRMTNKARESMGLVYVRRWGLRGTIGPDRQTLKHQRRPQAQVIRQMWRQQRGIAAGQPHRRR